MTEAYFFPTFFRRNKKGEVNASTCLFPSAIKLVKLEFCEYESIAVHHTQNMKQHLRVNELTITDE